MTRSEILKRADEIVNGERQKQYGDAENSFGLIGHLWTVYLDHLVTAQDVALMMILMKVAREKGGQGKADNWIDIAGYAACGGEIATEKPVKTEVENLDAEITGDVVDKLFDALFNHTPDDDGNESDEDDGDDEWPDDDPTDWWTDSLTGCQVGTSADGWVHVSLNRSTLPFGTAGFSDKTVDALIKSIGKSINEEVVDENKKNMMAMLWAVKRYKEMKEDEDDED